MNPNDPRAPRSSFQTNKSVRPHTSAQSGRSFAGDARDTLNAEIKQYSNYGELDNGATPSRKYQAAQQGVYSEEDYMAPFRKTTGAQPSQARRSQYDQKNQQFAAAGTQPAQKSQQFAAVDSRSARGSQQFAAVNARSTENAQRFSRDNHQYKSRSNAQRSQNAQRAQNRNANDFSSWDPADYLNRSKEKHQRARRNSRKKIIAALVAILVVVGGITGGIFYMNNAPVTVTVNGEQKTIQGAQRTLEGLVENGVVSVKPGNYIAVDDSVMREGEGALCTAKLNGEDTSDLKTHLNEGDTIEITDGQNIMEPYNDDNVQSIPASVEEVGVGAVHVYQGSGEAGEKVVRTGTESGKTVEVTTKEPGTIQLVKYNVNTNGDKVIALTFDDGPWDSSTAAILDILKNNNAKATFFTVGNRIPGHEDLIKRMKDEGHEIGTHTYDHASGSGKGVSLDLMSTQERRDEVSKGLQAITDAGGDASTTFRSPGGNFGAETARDVHDLVTSEIGWNIDTGDWQRPGADVIAQRIEMASPGNIILMHDGGGDRSQTVEALKTALPYLVEQGYEFITVDELLERYPYTEQSE